MKFLYFFILLFSINLSGSCQTIDSIIVGNGGGFSAQITAYKIQKNIVSKGKGSSVIKYHESAKVKKKLVKNTFKKSKQVFITIKEFDKPSNMYQYLELYSKGKKNRYVWGDTSFDTPIEVKNIYQQIIDLTKDINFQKK